MPWPGFGLTRRAWRGSGSQQRASPGRQRRVTALCPAVSSIIPGSFATIARIAAPPGNAARFDGPQTLRRARFLRHTAADTPCLDQDQRTQGIRGIKCFMLRRGCEMPTAASGKRMPWFSMMTNA